MDVYTRIKWIFKGFPFAIVCVFTLYCGISHAGIDGSLHDLSWNAMSDAKFQFITNQKCVFCHTPHGANDSVTSDLFYDTAGGYQTAGGGTAILLWNRDLANITGGAEYTMYNSSTMNYYSGEIRAYSLLCLSCHDGISALNVLYNLPNDVSSNGYTTIPPKPFGSTYIGDEFSSGSGTGWGPNIGERTTSDSEDINLTNDHPVSINYPDTDPSGGLQPLTSAKQAGLKFYPLPTNPSDLRSLECSTCHDVHNQGTENDGTYPFLRVSVKDSDMCTSCHVK